MKTLRHLRHIVFPLLLISVLFSYHTSLAMSVIIDDVSGQDSPTTPHSPATDSLPFSSADVADLLDADEPICKFIFQAPFQYPEQVIGYLSLVGFPSIKPSFFFAIPVPPG